MSPLTDILYFKPHATHAGDSNKIVSKLASQNPDKIDGMSKAYLGVETEDPSNAFLVVEWTSKSAFDAYHESDDFKAAHTAAGEVFASRPSHTLVQFPSTEAIFSAPATEFVTFTLKNGNTMDQLEPLVKQLQNKLPGTPMFYGSSWAPVTDKDDVYYGVLGWESVQAHWDAVGSGPLKEIIDKVKEIADIWLVHALLTPFNV